MRARLRTFLCLLTLVVTVSTASALQINPILQSSSDGLTANVTEQATSCSYDKNSLTPSMTPPPGCGPLNKSDWPQWRHDAGHSGYNPDERVVGPSNVGQLRMWWRMYTPGSSLFAVANGILYGFGIDYYTGQQNLYAVRETPGRPFLPVWMIPLDQFNDSCWADPLSRLTVDGGLVYLGCSSHSLYVIDAVTGVILDQTYIDYPFIVYKGNLYGSGQVETDTYVWGPTFFFELNHGQLGDCGPWGNIFCAAEGFASVDNGVALWNYSKLIVPIYQYRYGLLAMNVGEGSLAWYADGFSEDGPEPVVANGVVYTVRDGYLYALNAKNGQRLWSLPGLGKPIVSLTIAKASAMGYAACGQDGQDLCAFTLATGKIMWTASGGGTPLAAANGVVYANGAFDAKTGKWLGSVTSGMVSGFVANGMVYVTDGGSIAAYGPRR